MNSFGMTGIYVLLVAGNAVIAFALWYLRRSFASTDAMKKVEARLTELEAKYETLPTVDAVSALKLEMMELRGDIREVASQLNAFSHQLGLLLEQAVNRSKS
ncbi:DUF2730 family protein [Serratia marcescens]|uniref:DUF2730 family protein n=1 Tax=Serratia marcescens TaxID=615 RepID=UPI0027E43F95|nr:DUF2730 family protein [Serratia marcescens]MCX2172118.1 DUF2730 domain-containing protein [Serratia marcescens]MCX2178010.1 DUF2730 domain-containing protein [Serratia marcescens]